MTLMIGINVGFITNSSSCVYHFPRAVLEDPTMKAFLEAFEVQDGYIGPNLWHRSECGTLAITKEQKVEVRRQLIAADYGRTPGIDTESDDIVLIYGDEHRDLTAVILDMLRATLERMGLPDAGFGDDYN